MNIIPSGRPRSSTPRGHARTVVLGIALLGIAACASEKPPTAALTSARQAIEHAEQARVAEFAALDLAEARQKLADAQARADKKRMGEARMLAEQAQVAAELATAKAEAARAQAVNDEMQRSTRVLEHEMQRSNGEGS